ncbi:MAG: YggS family pyridoxal phosphate-dependent enzyme [Anaerovoracaceae bacterium]
MSQIKENLEKLQNEIRGKDPGVLLVAVTKTRDTGEINEAIEAGVTDIGENKVQEIIAKFDKVKPVKWHLIGHLQTNKVKIIIDKVDLIHSVDSLKLAKEIEKRAAQIDRGIQVLIQINPGNEESKFGVKPEEALPLINEILELCPHIIIKGLMCVARFSEDEKEIRNDFRVVKEVFDKVKTVSHSRLNAEFLSMGMSGDYTIAIEEGANIVRVGSAIFGSRQY